ncbi:MAG: PIN domain-containing protein [Deltaproteobacteria bacterium]|nr:PIN domain-containing protein [Deltaproteobacteria bacterium]
MPVYFDASVMLSLLTQDCRAAKAATLWHAHEDRVSSILVEAECRIVLRRLHRRQPTRYDLAWLAHAEAVLAQALDELTLRVIDTLILDIVRQEMQLASCRTLDALHVATALFFTQRNTTPIQMCTFDRRLAAVCADVAIPVLAA